MERKTWVRPRSRAYHCCSRLQEWSWAGARCSVRSAETHSSGGQGQRDIITEEGQQEQMDEEEEECEIDVSMSVIRYFWKAVPVGP